MIVVLIGVALVSAVIQFVYYCRSALASAETVELSAHALGVAGLKSGRLAAGDFQRFLELVRLCPEQRAETAGIRAVALYYRLLRSVDGASRLVAPALSAWARHEQQSCSHFAAVVLDRRISSSRDLLLQHAAIRR